MACQGHRQNNPFERGRKRKRGEVRLERVKVVTFLALHSIPHVHTHTHTDRYSLQTHTFVPPYVFEVRTQLPHTPPHTHTISNPGIIDQVAGSCQWPVACLTRPALPTSPRPPPSSLHTLEYKAENKEVRSCRVYTHPSK